MNKDTSGVLKELERQHQLNPLRQAVLKKELMDKLSNPPQPTHVAVRFFSYKTAISAAAVLVAIIIAGGSVYATETSLPGDFLHPIKLVAEKIETKLAVSEEKQARIEAEHTNKRIEEVRKLDIKASAQTNIEQKNEIQKRQQSAQVEIETHLEQTLDKLEQVKTKLNERGKDKAAEKLNISIERLKTRAAESRIKIKREKVREEEKRENKDDEKDERQPIPDRIQPVQEKEQPTLKRLIPNDSRENELEDSLK